jgi:hypothetical protein
MMHKLIQSLALLGALALLLANQALAGTVIEEETDGGALVKIEVPDEWNGSLVIYNHGFQLAPEPPGLGPLAERQLSQGYAVAASSYRQIGWAVLRTRLDLQNMMAVFRANFAEPDEVIVHGFSLGGIVTGQAIEKAKIGNVVGAYPACGAMAGSRSWDGALDLRLTYDAICSQVPGARIPGGGRGLPASFTEYPFDESSLVGAVQACFGLFSAPENRSADQASRLQQMLDVTQLPESWIATDMGFATLGLSDLIFDPDKLNGRRGMGNIGVTYKDAEIDATIRRLPARPGAQKKLQRKDMTGDVRGVKIVSTHTSNDGLVIVEHQQLLADLVPADLLTVGIVNEGELSTHCDFTEAELAGGWEALRAWVAGGPQPTVQDLQDTCLALEADESLPGPCRYDPEFVVPNMDGRVPPR